MVDETDRHLIGLLRDRDPAALESIAQTYQHELRLFCRRMVYSEVLAEDVLQEILMTCCRAEGDTLPRDSLRGWLYRIARNRCIDQIRKMKPEVRLSAVRSAAPRGMPRTLMDSATTPAARAVRQDHADLVQSAVDEMDGELRSVVIMHFYQGLSHADVAAALDLSVSGAKARVARAVRVLRQRLRHLNDSTS
ncbi:MAG: RNA polymerase sigma factor [Phycisphaerae bacterium]